MHISYGYNFKPYLWYHTRFIVVNNKLSFDEKGEEYYN